MLQSRLGSRFGGDPGWFLISIEPSCFGAMLDSRATLVAYETNSGYPNSSPGGLLFTRRSPQPAPTNVVILSGDRSVILHWDPDSEPNLAGYKVYRSTQQWRPIFTQNSSLLTSLGYCDLSVSDGQTYYYQVTAVNDDVPRQPAFGHGVHHAQSLCQ